jgi:hypothetical protein
METPIDGITRELDATTGVSKEEVCKLPESLGTMAESPS